MAEASKASTPGTAPANRLSTSTSPYLLQHAHNPVDWYPWGPEALARAKHEGKPIFLSIGYSACHWCHVMEREVFEKQDIANIMNQHFVNIKVDREERPDLDEIYMLATQIMTGQGGWPMSVWLTPDLEPFYAGTYFPPVDAMGRPGFPRIELALAHMWTDERAKLLEQAQRVVEGVRHYADEMAQAAAGTINLQPWLTKAIEDFADRFDPENGGLGTAPKFPPSQTLLLWLALLAPGQAIALEPESAASVLRAMLGKTLDRMAAGGMYDQIGGGFARYSTDAHWLVPHFEKMLYDNAQLAAVYALAGAQLGRPDYTRIARQTLDFWLREMTGPDGAFYSTLDADSEGHEGKFYVWTIAEIRAALPEGDDADLIIRHFGLTQEGNFEGRNVLHVAQGVHELAPQYGVTPDALQQRIDRLCVRLREARSRRIPPARDDKVLTGWNGLMISALAIAGRLLHEPRYLEAAHRAIGLLLTKHLEAGRRLLRTSRGATAHIPAFLEDHAYLLNGLMDLIDSTTPTSLPGTMARKRAVEMADTMIKLFGDPQHHGFFFTHEGHDRLFARLKNGTDNATPAAAAVAIRALLRLAQCSGKAAYRAVAVRAAEGFAGVIARQPSMFSTLLLALVEDTQGMASQPHLGGGPAAPWPAVAPAGAPATPLTLELVAALTTQPGGSLEIPLVLHVAAGFHVPPHDPHEREALATVARLRTDLPLASQEWCYPSPQQLPAGATTIEGLAGKIVISVRCTVAQHAAPGNYTIRATVLTQACTAASCRVPEKLTIEVPVEVRSS